MAILIIAEAGVNHNGSLALAKEMIEKAAWAGADYIKFQTFISENLVSSHAQKAEYQKASTGAEESQLQMLKKLELSYKDFQELKEYCAKCGIGFLSTPFDMESIDFLQELGVDFWKIPSGEITNLPYLERLAQSGKPIVMSTGMCDMEEIQAAWNVLQEKGAREISLLHCNTEYPTPYEDVNLRAMQILKEQFHTKVGYSDHTKGIEIPIAAAALGAEILEKHFTLDRNMEGPDHKASLEPEELKAMIDSVRHIEAALGKAEKCVTASEKKNRSVARKSIVASCHIRKGEILTEDKLTVKRPGDGISPMRWYEVIGTTAAKDYEKDQQI